MTPPSSAGAVVIDANVAVAISSLEAGRDVLANAELTRYLNQGYELYAPGAIVTETLYALCQKYQSALLSATEFDDAVDQFEVLMNIILPPPKGESSLVRASHSIGKGYGCSRSADSVYIALAAELILIRPTILLTFDRGVPTQAALYAPSVVVQLL